MGKETSCAPKQLDAGFLLFGLKLGDDGVKRCVGGGKIAQFGGDVAVVPAVKVDPNFLKKFKEYVDASDGIFDGV